MPDDAPEVVIKNLVRDEWDPSNTLTITPSVHHGWLEGEDVDEADPAYYEVTVSNPDEGPTNGGTTGYSGIDPTGAGPTQEIAGTVAVNAWAQRGREGVNGNGASANPRQAVFLFKNEIERIVHAHYLATDANDAETALAWLAPQGSTRLVETDPEPTIYRYQVTVGYGYRRRP